MSDQTKEQIRSTVTRLNDAWFRGRFDELPQYFDENAVLAHPGFERRTVGRQAIIDSYAEFARAATIHHFHAGEIQVDESGESIVTVSPWEMRYEYSGQTFDERGWDLLVFSRRDSGWRVVWRTVLLDTTPRAET